MTSTLTDAEAREALRTAMAVWNMFGWLARYGTAA